jgi:hypothetical protein
MEAFKQWQKYRTYPGMDEHVQRETTPPAVFDEARCREMFCFEMGFVDHADFDDYCSNEDCSYYERWLGFLSAARLYSAGQVP